MKCYPISESLLNWQELSVQALTICVSEPKIIPLSLHELIKL